MIVFYGDNFELDLTETKISLVEENPLFYNYFVKNYSWPFTKKVSDDVSRKLGFIDIENSADYETKYFGKLLIDNDFEDAYLLIVDIEDNILQGTIYYGKTSIALLDTDLSALPFPVIETTDLLTHAASVAQKQYPEVDYNFPMVIDPDFSSNNKYEAFDGVINNYTAGNYIANSIDTIESEDVAVNRNVMVPFPYVFAILKTAFDSVGIKMSGSFVSDKVNEKLLLYTDKYLEKFLSALPEGFSFNNVSETFTSDNVVVANHSVNYDISQTGSYTINTFLNFPADIDVLTCVITYKGNEIFRSLSNNVDKDTILNVEDAADFGNLNIALQLRRYTDNPSNRIGSVKAYNYFGFSFEDGELNIFPNTFSLSQIMPDLTFGEFLNKLKNWLNLEIIFGESEVTINYVESKFLEITFKDETEFEVVKPKRTPNQNKLFKLITSNDSIYIGKSGVVTNISGYRDEDITDIDMGLDVMPIKAKDTLFTAYKEEEHNDFKILMYNGLQDGLPTAVSSFADRSFSLEEVINRNWAKWLFFRLNSETYKDKFKVHVLEPFNVNFGRLKYNRKHIYRSIKKQRVAENYWQIEVESETLP